MLSLKKFLGQSTFFLGKANIKLFNNYTFLKLKAKVPSFQKYTFWSWFLEEIVLKIDILLRLRFGYGSANFISVRFRFGRSEKKCFGRSLFSAQSLSQLSLFLSSVTFLAESLSQLSLFHSSVSFSYFSWNSKNYEP